MKIFLSLGRMWGKMFKGDIDPQIAISGCSYTGRVHLHLEIQPVAGLVVFKEHTSIRVEKAQEIIDQIKQAISDTKKADAA